VVIICPVDTGDFRNLSGRNVLKPAQIANGVAGLPYGAYMRIFGTRFFRLAIVGSITNVLLFTSASPASAVCVINQAEIRQISDRSVMVVLGDSACTREFGEFGYYTEIAPDVFGEVMGGYGSRPIDSSGVGFRPGGYGYVIETPTPEPTYSAGVWVADADGVVHSAFMTIQNSYLTTTTSTTSTTVAPTTTTLAPSSSNSSTKADNQSIPKTTVTATTISDVIVDDGVEGDFAELAVRAIGNKWEIKAETSYSSTAMTVRFRKSGSRLVTWNIVTTGEGTRRILTSRNLSGGTLTLLAQGLVVDRLLVP
jgi:hypothetical protein